MTRVWRVTLMHPFFGALELIVEAGTSVRAVADAIRTGLPDDEATAAYLLQGELVIKVAEYHGPMPR